MLRDDTLLFRFPKPRSELPEAYLQIYAEHDKRNRAGDSAASSLSQKMESWMHRKVAGDVLHRSGTWTTLEIGAGNLNHLQYEPPSERYDVVEALTDIVEKSPRRNQVTQVYRDLSEVDRKYDRIISIAAFEHYCDLPDVVLDCTRLLAPGGELRIAVPSEAMVPGPAASSLL